MLFSAWHASLRHRKQINHKLSASKLPYCRTVRDTRCQIGCNVVCCLSFRFLLHFISLMNFHNDTWCVSLCGMQCKVERNWRSLCHPLVACLLNENSKQCVDWCVSSVSITSQHINLPLSAKRFCYFVRVIGGNDNDNHCHSLSFFVDVVSPQSTRTRRPTNDTSSFIYANRCGCSLLAYELGLKKPRRLVEVIIIET